MSRVRVLDAVLANQIAAGEVVERPASAAKELLENALDAGATQITCEIAQGGVALLRVVDNGSGMSPEDAERALERHATSKIQEVGDLNQLSTLGFRGEALPSIASVSRLSIRTRRAEDVGATSLRVEGGALVERSLVGGPVGTELRVEDLFYNVPARRKFLKLESTEASRVLEIMQQLAICHPQVAFRFIKDGREQFSLPAHTQLIDRAQALFGESYARDLSFFERQEKLAKVDGLLGTPEEARSTPRHYYLFINGRPVRDRVMMSAVQSAYGARLDRRKHPFVIVRLTIPAEWVDVNVHPAKTEVRFVDSKIIYRLVSRAIADGLEAAQTRSAPAQPYTLQMQSAAPQAAAGVGAPGDSTAPAAPGVREEPSGLDGHRRRIFEAMARVSAQRGMGLAGLSGGAPGWPSAEGGAGEPPSQRGSADAMDPNPLDEDRAWSGLKQQGVSTSDEAQVHLEGSSPPGEARPAVGAAAYAPPEHISAAPAAPQLYRLTPPEHLAPEQRGATLHGAAEGPQASPSGPAGAGELADWTSAEAPGSDAPLWGHASLAPDAATQPNAERAAQRVASATHSAAEEAPILCLDNDLCALVEDGALSVWSAQALCSHLIYARLSPRFAAPCDSAPITLPSALAPRMQQGLAQLEALGITLEAFGPHTWRLTQAPALAGTGPLSADLLAVLPLEPARWGWALAERRAQSVPRPDAAQLRAWIAEVRALPPQAGGPALNVKLSAKDLRRSLA